MKEIWTEKYADGIAFNIGDDEIAFWNNIIGMITYNELGIGKAYPNHKSYGCVILPFEDSKFIVDTIVANI